jgi:hypothetical protein
MIICVTSAATAIERKKAVIIDPPIMTGSQ